MTRTCPGCGITFQTKTSRGMFCNKACYKKDVNRREREKRAANRPVRVCKWCGVSFTIATAKQTLCSDECARQNRNKWSRDYQRAQNAKKGRPTEVLCRFGCGTVLPVHSHGTVIQGCRKCTKKAWNKRNRKTTPKVVVPVFKCSTCVHGTASEFADSGWICARGVALTCRPYGAGTLWVARTDTI